MDVRIARRRLAGRRLLWRLIAVVLIAAGSTLLGAIPELAASARQSSAGVATLALSPTSGPIGSSVVVTGSGFPRRQSGTLSWNGANPMAVRADGQGAFTATLTVPQASAGVNPVAAAIGTTTASASFTVTTPVQPTPTATATLVPAASGCSTTLQALVDAAAPGSTVTVPACIFRETVTIGKSLTLDGQGKAEIRGSDAWSTGWAQSGSYWVRGTLPQFAAHGTCKSGTSRCLWPEQVFFDGRPLVQVASSPSAGQFAVNGARQVVLADNPGGHQVEVSVRTRWVRATADKIVIRGFIMKHAANDAQSGAIGNQDRSVSNLTLDNNVLSDTHGAVISISGGSGVRVLRNDISRGGQEGIQGWQSQNALVQANQIYGNNTEGFDPTWEAGGVKMAQHVGLVADGNVVHDNDGPGLWCDIGCKDVVFSNNRVYRNGPVGIWFEISNGAKIVGNSVWSNSGWAGIYISSSANAEVSTNTLAWNSQQGIFVNSQDRPDRTSNQVGVIGNNVHDNTVVVGTLGAAANRWTMEFADALFAPSSNNRGAQNAYWYPAPENGAPRFAWNGDIAALSSFNATPAEEGARYLTTAERDRLLAAAGVPLAP